MFLFSINQANKIYTLLSSHLLALKVFSVRCFCFMRGILEEKRRQLKEREGKRRQLGEEKEEKRGLLEENRRREDEERETRRPERELRKLGMEAELLK